MIGTTLSHFEITAKLGEGGMGEVYRATDTTLAREVAIKVLPTAFTSDAERLARFEREAKILASLNHPNIAGIHQIEEVDETWFLVMELIPGEDLAGVLGRGAVPIPEAIRLATQMAEALEAAHGRGVIHRDLKPANIKITSDGQVKILDFGLAKAREAASDGGADQSRSPTLTAQMTEAGVILGTAAYMSPEQARGQDADARADIWSFGVVLFEMLTAERLFAEPTVSDTLAAVLRADIDWGRLPGETPGGVRRLLRRCLEREPRQRLHAVADVRIELEEVAAGGEEASPTEPQRVGTTPRSALLGAIAGLALIAGALLGAMLWPRESEDSRTVRAFIPPPAHSGFELHPYLAGAVAVSPDGTRFVYSVRPERGPAMLWIRAIDETDARPLEGTQGAINPFWSPDSRFVAFFAEGELKKIEASGGPVVSITTTTRGLALHYGGGGLGGTWGRNGDILYALGWDSPLYRVAASGGEPEPLSATQLLRDKGVFRAGAIHPRFLPDGDRFLFVVGGENRQHKLMLASLSGEAPRELMGTLSYAEVAGGHLWFTRKGTLFAQRFDPDAGALLGEPVPVAQGTVSNVWSESSAQGNFSTSPAGVIAYHTGFPISESVLTWYSRQGVAGDDVGSPSFQYQVSLAPDATRAMLQVGEMKTFQWGLWTYDLARGVRSRFNSRRGVATGVWSPDGRELFFQHGGRIFRQAMGVDEATLFRDGDAAYGREGIEIAWPLDWSPDGQHLVFASVDEGSLKNGDLWVVPVESEGAPVPIQQSPLSEEDAAISPDGRWLAYTSNKSGQYEIYLTEFPESRRALQVSGDGGIRPEWGATMEELFFLSPDDTLMVATIETEGEEASVRDVNSLFPLDVRHHVLFEPGGYAVASDGRFLVNRVLEKGTTSPIALIVGWPEELKQSN